jgi:hypothetical protein
MKLQKTIFSFVLSAALFTSCIDEDLSVCGGDVVLRFDYPYNGFVDFNSRVRRVNVGIYGADGVLVERRQLETEDLEAFRGMKTNLPVGDYTAVCWGNAYDNTTIDWDKQRVYHPHLTEANTPIMSDDDLTYGATKFSVTTQEGTDTVHFEPAHIKFEIAVKDMPNVTASTTKGELPYYINIDGLHNEVYDFDMNLVQDDDRTYLPDPVEFPVVGTMIMYPNIHRTTNQNPITINLIQKSTRVTVKSVSLEDFIAENPEYTIVPKKELTIKITFDFDKEAQVTVYPVAWNKVDVLPIQ